MQLPAAAAVTQLCCYCISLGWRRSVSYSLLIRYAIRCTVPAVSRFIIHCYITLTSFLDYYYVSLSLSYRCILLPLSEFNFPTEYSCKLHFVQQNLCLQFLRLSVRACQKVFSRHLFTCTLLRQRGNSLHLQHSLMR